MHGARLRRAKLLSKLFLMRICGRGFRFEKLLKRQEDTLENWRIGKNWRPFGGPVVELIVERIEGPIGEPIRELNDEESIEEPIG